MFCDDCDAVNDRKDLLGQLKWTGDQADMLWIEKIDFIFPPGLDVEELRKNSTDYAGLFPGYGHMVRVKLHVRQLNARFRFGSRACFSIP